MAFGDGRVAGNHPESHNALPLRQKPSPLPWCSRCHSHSPRGLTIGRSGWGRSATAFGVKPASSTSSLRRAEVALANARQPRYTGPAVVGGKVFIMDRVLQGGEDHDESLFPHRAPKGHPGSERVLCFSAADGKNLEARNTIAPTPCRIPAGRARRRRCMTASFTRSEPKAIFFASRPTPQGRVEQRLRQGVRCEAAAMGPLGSPVDRRQQAHLRVGGEGSVAVAFDKNTGKELWRAFVAVSKAMPRR